MKASPDGVTGVLLAGGNSSRMGRNKALMPLAGRRLVDRALGVLAGLFDDLLMVTNSPDLYADLGIRMVPDLVAGKGALGGIHSAVHHAAAPHCLVVACDMPFLNADVLRYLADERAGYDVVVPNVERQAAAAARRLRQGLPAAHRPAPGVGSPARGGLLPGRAGAGSHSGRAGGFRPRGPVVSQPQHAGGIRRRRAPAGPRGYMTCCL